MIIYILIFFLILFFLFLYWKFYFFFRNPERIVPDGNNIVSPADGTVVYIRKIDNSLVPMSIKGKKEIKLNEIIKVGPLKEFPYYIIGVFMHPTSVHINRAPIKGVIRKIVYTKSRNLPMTLMWWRVLSGKRPYELYSRHIIENERNTTLIEGEIPLYVVQIGDVYVNKIESWIKENESVEKGQRIGIIKMGSQVDIVFPASPYIKIIVNEGQKVKAGESILAKVGV